MSQGQLLHPSQPVPYGGNGQDHHCDSTFHPYVDAIVYHGIGNGMPAFPGIGGEEDPAREGGEDPAAEDAQEIPFDQAVPAVGEQPGQTQCAEGQQVINHQLHGKEHVRVEEELEYPVGHCSGKPGSQTRERKRV